MDKPISLMVIDDNRHFLIAISEYIEDHYPNQIQVLAAGQSGKEGIRLARQHHPQIVLLDLKLPDMHGFMLIPLLRQVIPDVKIITTTLISADLFEHSGNIYQEESLKAGADTFIPKYRLDKDLAPFVLKLINPNHNQKLGISTNAHH